jgi:predicted PurR-regulated permease PerM
MVRLTPNITPGLYRKMETRRFDDRQLLLWITLAAFVGTLFYFLAPILSPFLLAAILAYICNPLVERMAGRNVPRGLAATLVLMLVTAIFALMLFILLPLLVGQVRAVAEQMPMYVDWLRTTVDPWVRRTFAIELDVQLVKDWLADHMAEIQSVALKLLPSLRSGGRAVIALAVNLVLVPVVLFYLLRDWDRLIRNIDLMIPRRWHVTARQLAREIDRVLGEFLRGQLLVMLLMGLFYVIALWFVGLEYALSVGLIAGLFTFVPYLGVIAGAALATLTGVLQFDDSSQLWWIWGVFLLGSVLEGYVFVPFLVGDRIGLHPLVVIFALLAFAQLFGFFGVLLALPVSAALLVWLRHLRGRYLGSGVYNAGSSG